MYNVQLPFYRQCDESSSPPYFDDMRAISSVFLSSDISTMHALTDQLHKGVIVRFLIDRTLFPPPLRGNSLDRPVCITAGGKLLIQIMRWHAGRPDVQIETQNIFLFHFSFFFPFLFGNTSWRPMQKIEKDAVRWHSLHYKLKSLVH